MYLTYQKKHAHQLYINQSYTQQHIANVIGKSIQTSHEMEIMHKLTTCIAFNPHPEKSYSYPPTAKTGKKPAIPTAIIGKKPATHESANLTTTTGKSQCSNRQKTGNSSSPRIGNSHWKNRQKTGNTRNPQTGNPYCNNRQKTGNSSNPQIGKSHCNNRQKTGNSRNPRTSNPHCNNRQKTGNSSLA